MTRTAFVSAFRILIIGVPLALGACRSADLAMPTGYTYHNEIYKSRPGPEAPPPAKILKAGDIAPDGMTVVQTESVTFQGGAGADGMPVGQATMCIAADDLIGRLLRNFGRPMEPVLVRDMSPLAGCLKQALQRSDVPLAAKAGDGPFVLDNFVQGSSGSITFLSNHEPVTSESGAYNDAPVLIP